MVAKLSRADQKRVLKLVTPEEAFSRLQKAISRTKLDYEVVSIENACGRVLAENVVSRVDIPSLNRAAVDGYAVKSKETKNATPKTPLKLMVKGELFPSGNLGSLGLSRGETVYLACGAPVPEGFDAVVRVEDTRRHGKELEVCRSLEKGKNVIAVGEDVEHGSIVLNEGRLIGPYDVGMLAALRTREVKVVRKPRVAVISVGDELTELEDDEPSKTVNNYALIVAAMASDIGASSNILGIARDVEPEIVKKIEKALALADIIVTIGGCSVGLKDFVPDAVNAFGKPGVIVHGIKMTPGKVTGIGVVKGKPVVLLPGHIVSSVAGFHLFVAPLIRLYGGMAVLSGIEIRAKASQDIVAKPRMQLFLRVCVKKIKDGFVAEPVHGGSSSLSTLMKANGFTVLNEGATVKKGDEFTVTLFSEKELLQL